VYGLSNSRDGVVGFGPHGLDTECMPPAVTALHT
jgi:hypothetical protein